METKDHGAEEQIREDKPDGSPIDIVGQTTTEAVDKICTKCGRHGHWAQEHALCYPYE